MSPLILLAALQGTAMAQSNGFDAHGLHLAAFDGDLRDPLLVQRPGRFRQWDWFAGGAFEFSQGELVFYEPQDDGTTNRDPWLTNVFGLNLSAGVAFHERVRLDLAMPLYFTSTGPGGQANGFDAGDLRATLAVNLLSTREEDDGGFGLAVLGNFDAPTGASAEFLGNRTVAGGGRVAATYGVGLFTVSADLGAQFNPAITLENLNGSDRLEAGLGLGFLVHETTSINLEGQLGVPFKKAGRAGTETPGEAVLSVRHRRPSGLHFLAGGAMGWAPGAGDAAWRVFLGAGYGVKKAAPPPDTDGDGILDVDDACVTEPETFNDIEDTDGCPEHFADLNVNVLWKGEPLSGANVSIAGPESLAETYTSGDAKGYANQQPATDWTGHATRGCLAGDGAVTLVEGDNALDITMLPVGDAIVRFEVVDQDDKPIPGATASWKSTPFGCVDAEQITLTDGTGQMGVRQGTWRVLVTAPEFGLVQREVEVPVTGETLVRVQLATTKVQLTEQEVMILDMVYFDFDKDTIQERSYGLLNEVAATLIAHDLSVEVQGHTDSRGNDEYNLDLSQRRSEAVMRYLIGQGVKAERLVAKGYGESQPIATNDTESGRAKNRRVVFSITGRGE